MKRVIIVLASALACLVQTLPVSAAQQDCSFKKSVRQNGITFNVASRPAAGCAIQILTISAHQGGRQIAITKADVDYLARSAQAVDLTGDGKPELTVISKASGTFSNEMLDVYYLEGNVFRRTGIPELEDKSGYKGGERFRLEGRQIIRTVPLYRENDSDRNPSGGIRTFKYDFRDGKITPSAQDEAPAVPARIPAEESHHRAISQPASDAASAPTASSKPEIAEIRATETGIEIIADRPIEKFKTMHLSKPERMAIDIPGAASKLNLKKAVIGKFGISNVRVGLNKGFLRVVLDSGQADFPKHTITASKTGLLIQFNQ